MNHMIEALKKKLVEAKASKGDGEAELSMHGEDKAHLNEEEPDGDTVAGNAPHLDHDIEVDHHAKEGSPQEEMHESPHEEELEQMSNMKSMHMPAAEGSDMHMKALQAISDHNPQGRSPMSLHERAGAGANEKMKSIEAMKKRKGI